MAQGKEKSISKTFKKASDIQEKLENATNSIEGQNLNLDQNHNSKKVSLGPNTER